MTTRGMKMETTRATTENNRSLTGEDSAARQKPNGKETGLLPPRLDRVTEQVDFAQLPDGSLVELIQSPQDPGRTSLALFKDGQVRIGAQVRLANRILVPVPKNRWPMGHLVLPRGTQPYLSMGDLLRPSNRGLR